MVQWDYKNVHRNSFRLLTSVSWTEDISVEWDGAEGLCRIEADFDYRYADVRIARIRGDEHRYLAADLGSKKEFRGEVELNKGDIVAIHWRAFNKRRAAHSETAWLRVEEIEGH